MPNTVRVVITLPTDVLRLARKQVKTDSATSLSAFISEAIDEKLRRDELQKLLDELAAREGR
jgi:hypothetical protein